MIEMKDTIKKVKKAVVKIECSDPSNGGSGFLVSKDGYIFTCHHVVFSYEEQRYSEDISIIFSDGQYKMATIIESDGIDNNELAREYDYAILKIEDGNYDHLLLGKFDSAEEGDEVYFCGYPFDTYNHVTHLGMISTKYIYQDERISVEPNVFQIDGSINRGNSGGPLILKKTDEVIGIVSFRFGGISDELENVREHITQIQNPNNPIRRNITFIGVNPLNTMLELIDTLDNYISTGMGLAISIEYVRHRYQELLS